MKRFFAVAVLVVLAGVTVMAAETALPVLGVTSTLSRLLELARDNSPQLRAYTDRAAAAAHEVAAVDGYFDAQITASSGFADGAMRAPGSLLPSIAPNESWITEAAVEQPWRNTGLKLRGSLSRWDSIAGGAADNKSGTLAGVAVEKPLLRDRNFAKQRLEREAAQYDSTAAQALRQAAWQETCHAMTIAYVDWLAACAEMTESLAASGRVSKLLQETEKRVELETTPAYQLAPARMEVAFSLDSVHQAQASLDAARIKIAEIIGSTALTEALEKPQAGELRHWADACANAATNLTLLFAVSARPEWHAATAQALAADALARRAREEMKSDLSLFGGAGWRLNNEPGKNGDSDFAWEAGVVWRRPWGYYAEREHAAARSAEANAAQANLAATINTMRAEFERAGTTLAAACQRLQSVDRAVEEARANLDAEAERFRLGEGRSRLVLDAQKDLTTASRSANAAAAQAVRAYIDQARAAGVVFYPFRAVP